MKNTNINERQQDSIQQRWELSPKLIHKFNSIPIKIPTISFLKDTHKIILKFKYKGKETRKDKIVLEKANMMA